MTYRCPVCSHPLEPYGTGGMVCPSGHHFDACKIKQQRPAVRQVGRREVMVRPWLPGAVLGALALLVALVDLVV